METKLLSSIHGNLRTSASKVLAMQEKKHDNSIGYARMSHGSSSSLRRVFVINRVTCMIAIEDEEIDERRILKCIV